MDIIARRVNDEQSSAPALLSLLTKTIGLLVLALFLHLSRAAIRARTSARGKDAVAAANKKAVEAGGRENGAWKKRRTGGGDVEQRRPSSRRRRNRPAALDAAATTTTTTKMATNERSRFDMEQALAMRRGESGRSRRTTNRRSKSPPSADASASSFDESSAAAAAAAALAAAAASETDSSAAAFRDVKVALEGLDRAEHMSSSSLPLRDWEEAMILYELSIGRLIKFLNATKGSSKKGGGGGPSSSSEGGAAISRDVVAERVRAALTEAEELKGRIREAKAAEEEENKATKAAVKKAGTKGKGAAKKTTPKKKRPSPTRPSGDGGWGGLTSALTSAFGGKSSRSLGSKPTKVTATKGGGDAKATTKAAAGAAAAATTSPGYAAATAASRRRANGSDETRGEGTQAGAGSKAGAGARTAAGAAPRSASHRSKATQQHPYPPKQPTKPPSKQRGKRRPLLNYLTQDPYVSAIKNELYVDSSTLNVKWDDIAGLDDAKRSMQEAAILPLLRPDLYTGLRTAPRGILLYGPPGTGKTMLVKAVAHESQCILFACTASALTSKWHGEGEKLVRTLFKMAADVAPSILFFDEIDALLGRRKGDEHEASRRFKTEFMVQMDGIASPAGVSGGGGGKSGAPSDGDSSDSDEAEQAASRRVLVLGCTNTPWDLDDAVMRRFQRRIYVPLPDAAAREAIFESMLRKAGKGGHDITSRQVSRLVSMTEGYSCSDIASAGQEAAFGPLRELGSGIEAVRDVDKADVRPLKLRDFEEVFKKGKRSVSRALLERYDEWEREQSGSGLR